MDLRKPQKYAARVSDKQYLTENKRFLLVKMELVQPDRVEFEVGQYVSLKINEVGERRSYSIASTPDDNHGFWLVAEILPEGKGSRFLQNIEIGGEVEVLAPMGRFVIKSSSDPVLQSSSKLLFVGTGTGIVPLWSMIHDLLINKKETRQMRLHWGMRSEEDLFWLDELEQLSEEHPNFVFDIVLSKPSQEWELCNGHVQDCLMRDFAPSAGSGLSGWEGYVCGRPETVVEIVAKLKELGMPEEKIYHEKFS